MWEDAKRSDANPAGGQYHGDGACNALSFTVLASSQIPGTYMFLIQLAPSQSRFNPTVTLMEIISVSILIMATHPSKK